MGAILVGVVYAVVGLPGGPGPSRVPEVSALSAALQSVSLFLSYDLRIDSTSRLSCRSG